MEREGRGRGRGGGGAVGEGGGEGGKRDGGEGEGKGGGGEGKGREGEGRGGGGEVGDDLNLVSLIRTYKYVRMLYTHNTHCDTHTHTHTHTHTFFSSSFCDMRNRAPCSSASNPFESNRVSDLTPASTTFLETSAESPFRPHTRTRQPRSLQLQRQGAEGEKGRI